MHTPRSPLARIPIGGLIAGALVLLVPIAYVLLLVWIGMRTLADRFPFLTDTILIAFALAVAVFVVGVLVLLPLGMYNRWAGRNAVDAANSIAFKQAEVQVAPLATSLRYEIKHALPAPAEMLALAPIDVLKPLGEWMAWVDEQPHTLLGGRTKAGKTWLATALLERRIDRGSDVFILDPHSSDWMGLPTAGGSGPAERREALKAVLSEYLRRMAQREEHKRQTGRELPHDYFDPLVVLVDEANAMLEELAAEWKTVLKVISSGARKVGISLICIAQSPLVEDLGISGAMRENFSRIALDERTVQTMIDSERVGDRKKALQAAFTTMDRPAAAQIGAQTWLLDRRGLSPGNASAGAQLWAGWDFASRKVSAHSRGARPETLEENISQDAKTVSASQSHETRFEISLAPAEIVKIAASIARNETQTTVVKAIPGYRADKHAAFVAKYHELKAQVEA